MDKPEAVIVRGSLTYYLFKNSVLVDIAGWQFLSYNIYNNSNRASLRKFKEKIKNSNEHQYNTPLKQMELALEHKLLSVGANKPKDEWRV